MAKEPLIGNVLKYELSALYQQSDRHYHNLAHIEALLSLLHDHRQRFADPEAVEAAIWFHDAIYDSKRADNETRSAELARERLSGTTSSERLSCIVAMVEATATHQPPALLIGDCLRDALLFLDMDLAILGSSPDTFEAYDASVRLEYEWVSDKDWRRGRAAVLRTFLERPAIFQTKLFRQRYEAIARRNIARSISKLDRQE